MLTLGARAASRRWSGAAAPRPPRKPKAANTHTSRAASLASWAVISASHAPRSSAGLLSGRAPALASRTSCSARPAGEGKRGTEGVSEWKCE